MFTYRLPKGVIGEHRLTHALNTPPQMISQDHNEREPNPDAPVQLEGGAMPEKPEGAAQIEKPETPSMVKGLKDAFANRGKEFAANIRGRVETYGVLGAGVLKEIGNKMRQEDPEKAVSVPEAKRAQARGATTATPTETAMQPQGSELDDVANEEPESTPKPPAGTARIESNVGEEGEATATASEAPVEDASQGDEEASREQLQKGADQAGELVEDLTEDIKGTHMEKLTGQLDAAMAKLEKAEKPAEQFAAFLQALGAIIEMIKRAFDGTLMEQVAQEKEGEDAEKPAEEGKEGAPKSAVEEVKEPTPEAAREKIAEKQEKITANKETIAAVEKQVDAQNESNKELRKQSAELEGQLGDLIAKNAPDAEVQALRTRVDALQKQITAGEEALDTLDKQRDSLRAENEKLSKDVEDLSKLEQQLTFIGKKMDLLLQLVTGVKVTKMEKQPDGTIAIHLDVPLAMQDTVRETKVDGAVLIINGAEQSSESTQSAAPENAQERLTEEQFTELQGRVDRDMAEITNLLFVPGSEVAVQQKVQAMNGYMKNVHTRLPEGHKLFELRLRRALPVNGKEYVLAYNESKGEMELTTPETEQTPKPTSAATESPPSKEASPTPETTPGAPAPEEKK